MTVTDRHTCSGCGNNHAYCICDNPPAFHTTPNGDTPDPYHLFTPLIDWPEFWQRDHAGEDWIAWPVLPTGRQVALYAPAKGAKSSLTINIAAAIATGRDILGQPNPNGPRHTLYLDYEQTEDDLHERLDDFGYTPDDNLDHLHYALLPNLPPLNTDKGSTALCLLAAHVQAEAVIVDTMGRAIHQNDENQSTAYMQFAQTTGLALKAAGRAVLRTDHAGKDKERGQRGSSGKNDDPDVVIRIDKTDNGLTLTTTHTRIPWVPPKVIVTRHVATDGLITYRADTTGRTYVEGTRELVAVLRALGVTHETTRRQASDTAAAAGEKARTKRIADALRWMRDELPAFTEGPPIGSGTTTGTKKTTQTGTTTGTTNTPAETPSVTGGNHDGNHAEPRPEVTGNQGGGDFRNHPGSPPTLDDDF